MGKRRTAIEKIDSPTARNVCFTKRRQGLFKKAAELSRLHYPNLQISAVAFSPAGKPFAFGNPSLLLHHHVTSTASSDHHYLSNGKQNGILISEIKRMVNVDVSKLSVSELKDYSHYLEKLRSDIVLMSVEENRKDETRVGGGGESGIGGGEYSSGSGLTIDEIFSDFEEEEDDYKEDGVDFENREEFEGMVRELLVDDVVVNCNVVGTDEDHDEFNNDDDMIFSGLSADEFLNELLNIY